jgi:hypothetical protein
MYCHHCPACRDYKPEHVLREITGPIMSLKTGGFVWIINDDQQVPVTPDFKIPSFDRIPRSERWFRDGVVAAWPTTD